MSVMCNQSINQANLRNQYIISLYQIFGSSKELSSVDSNWLRLCERPTLSWWATAMPWQLCQVAMSKWRSCRLWGRQVLVWLSTILARGWALPSAHQACNRPACRQQHLWVIFS